MPDPFRPPDNHVAFCADCGKEDLKRNMKTLYVKANYGQSLKVLCHLCNGCFRELVRGLDIKQTTKRRKRK